ncbi:MAG TPA: hypothetical protein DCM86_15545 [Verrucomicrobiales bacterium]|nr:hypothetical protein [Verrucomicrobiales bacterium]
MTAPGASLHGLTWDVALAGGGPAAATLSTLLAQRGYRCLVLENHTFPRYHVGESLLPATNRVLAEMEVLPAVRAAQFRRKHGLRVVGREGTWSMPFHFSEALPPQEAETWHVERARFDRILLDNAASCGAVVREGIHVERVLFDQGRATGLIAVDRRGKPLEIAARVVVDATGRNCLLGRQLGLISEVSGMRKACAWAYHRGVRLPNGIEEGETTLFLIPGGGWAWCIPLPAGIYSIGVVGEAEAFGTELNNHELAYLRTLQRSDALREALAPASRVGHCRCLGRIAYRNSQTVGPGWIMLGDARSFMDPVYSQGLTLAILSAAIAAEGLHEALASGDLSPASLGRHEPRIDLGFENARRLAEAFYHPGFTLPDFLHRFPDERRPLVQCLAGDLFRDHSSLASAFEGMAATHSTLEAETEAPVASP